MSIIVNFSERFRAIRENRGWSQAKVADFLGVSAGTIGHWETKKSAPNLEELERVATKLNEPVAYLLGLSDSFVNPQKGLVLREHHAGPSPWSLLKDETLRMAMKDFSSADEDEAMAFLEEVVGEVRLRGRRSKNPSGKPQSKVS